MRQPLACKLCPAHHPQDHIRYRCRPAKRLPAALHLALQRVDLGRAARGKVLRHGGPRLRINLQHGQGDACEQRCRQAQQRRDQTRRDEEQDKWLSKSFLQLDAKTEELFRVLEARMLELRSNTR